MASQVSFKMNTSEIKRMARDLEKTVPGTKAAVNAELRKGGLIVAMEARALSSWSSRIPGSVRVGGGFGKIVVRAGGGRAPHAAPFEHGGVPGEFRHPVFGNRDVWVKQGARPFMGPAADRQGPAVEAAVRRGVSEVFTEAGF